MKKFAINVVLIAANLVILCGFVSSEEEKTTTQTSNAINLYPQKCGVSIVAERKWLIVNDNDDNVDEKWDMDVEPISDEKDTIKISVTGTADKSDATVTVSIIEGPEHIDGFWPGTLKIDGAIQNAGGQTEAALEKSGKEKNGPKKMTFTVPAGKTAIQTLYIEGILHSDKLNDVKISAKIVAPEITIEENGVQKKYKACEANTDPNVELTVYQVDLDVDSKNNNAFDFAGFDKPEDEVEFSQKQTELGKVCISNNQRHPQSERVPGWADGFNATESAEDDSLAGIQFTPVRIRLEKPLNPSLSKIRFIYNASPPSGVTTQQIPNTEASNYVLPEGLGRLWKANASTKRNKDSVMSIGDFIPANIDIPWSKIAEGDSADIYFECVRGSISKESLNIVVTEGDVVCKDAVNLSFESLEIVSQGYIAELNDDVFNYIEVNEKARNEATNRIKIAGDLRYRGPNSVTANLTSSVPLQDKFTPASGSGEFQAIVRSFGTAAEQSANRTISADRAQIEHKMRHAIYRRNFHITAYSTSNEADFNGNSVNDVEYYVRSLNHYYYIHSNVAARDQFLKDVSIEGFGITLNNITLQSVDAPRAVPNPRPAGTNEKTRFFTVNMVQRAHPLGIANRPLVYDNSCAITRYKGTIRGQTIPDSSTIIVVGAANTTYKNRAGNDVTLVATRSCVDKVTDQLGGWHIDMYIDAKSRDRDRINFNRQVVLMAQP